MSASWSAVRYSLSAFDKPQRHGDAEKLCVSVSLWLRLALNLPSPSEYHRHNNTDAVNPCHDGHKEQHGRRLCRGSQHRSGDREEQECIFEIPNQKLCAHESDSTQYEN